MDIFRAETGKDIHINLLVYGATGVGKTTFLGSAEACSLTAPMLLVDVEGGILSLAGSDIDIVRPQSFADIQEIYNFLRFDTHRYRSVGIDSLTEIQRKLSMGGILGDLDEDDEEKRYQNLEVYKPPDRYDWLSSGEQMRKFIRAFRDLAHLAERGKRMHVLFAALEKKDQERSVVCPSLPGVLGVDVGGSVDMLARLSIQQVVVGQEEEERELRNLLFHTRTDDDGEFQILAKVRKPLNADFPHEIWRPTVYRVLRAWIEAATGVAKRSPRRQKRKKMVPERIEKT